MSERLLQEDPILRKTSRCCSPRPRSRDRAAASREDPDEGTHLRVGPACRRRDGSSSPLQEAGLRTRRPGGPVEILTERSHSSCRARRPRAAGKFLFANGQKLFVRGVTYGTFRPGSDGRDFPRPDVVERDFRAMADNSFNSVRLYSIPREQNPTAIGSTGSLLWMTTSREGALPTI
jgi:hypothetical protein